MREWESVIGLEVHLQLKTGTKVWCGCSADYDNAEANTHTCPICLGHPGALPKLNKKVVEYAVKAGLALNCKINNESSFDRKNYFYPDTPKNYQITQFDNSYAGKGYLEFKLNSGRMVKVGITKLQIEEDAAKSIHAEHESLINFNRASIPLIEIISEPDMRSSEEAYEYLNTLKSVIKYTGISDVSMELGSLRCDANISVMEKGSKVFGTRVEVKNLNSFKAVARAIDYEISRQIETIENGGKIDQETRLWDEETQTTKVMRSKDDQRTALFIIISDTDDTFNFVVAMMYSQLFNLLCDRADDVHHGRLPYHVRILCDEFANIGQIPKFDKLIATIRSREISASIILQSQSQLKTIYKDAAETILGNCDTMLFLGGKESSTLKEISETLGKETIDLYNTSDTRGQSRSYGMNYQKTGKELMSRDELAVMDGSKCILQLRGVRPFFSDKFDITKHKRYKELSDYDKKNEFDVEAYMRHRMEVKLTRTQEFDLYEFSEESLAGELNTENKEAEHVKDSDT